MKGALITAAGILALVLAVACAPLPPPEMPETPEVPEAPAPPGALPREDVEPGVAASDTIGPRDPRARLTVEVSPNELRVTDTALVAVRLEVEHDEPFVFAMPNTCRLIYQVRDAARGTSVPGWTCGETIVHMPLDPERPYEERFTMVPEELGIGPGEYEVFGAVGYPDLSPSDPVPLRVVPTPGGAPPRAPPP